MKARHAQTDRELIEARDRVLKAMEALREAARRPHHRLSTSTSGWLSVLIEKVAIAISFDGYICTTFFY